MRTFKHIALILKTKRIEHPKSYSQSELSDLLGYKNGQFISNFERGLCNMPLKMLKTISVILDINPEELKATLLKDHEETLANYFNSTPIVKKVKMEEKKYTSEEVA